jgi:inositol-1,3,4-trisphosphate 5/6-kinase/inositol-tetrakisphosphate 1-kinase
MKLTDNEEITMNGTREMETTEQETSSPCSLVIEAFPVKKSIIVGYALTSKKIKSFLQPKLEGLARFVILIFNPNFIVCAIRYYLGLNRANFEENCLQK